MASADIRTIGLGLREEDTRVGFRFRTIGLSITDADTANFVSVSGMPEWLFINLQYLRDESLSAGRRPAPSSIPLPRAC